MQAVPWRETNFRTYDTATAAHKPPVQTRSMPSSIFDVVHRAARRVLTHIGGVLCGNDELQPAAAVRAMPRVELNHAADCVPFRLISQPIPNQPFVGTRCGPTLRGRSLLKWTLPALARPGLQAHHARSLSDLGIVGCNLAAAVHFSPAFCPIATAMGLQTRQKMSSLGPNFASTPQARQAPNGAAGAAPFPGRAGSTRKTRHGVRRASARRQGR